MPVPISNFEFKATGLSVSFTNRSVGGTTYLWNFGFLTLGSPTTSTALNPTQEFPSPGIYEVSLTATNVDGSHTFQMVLVVNLVPTINLTILEMVINQIPKGVSMSRNSFNNLIQKWQLYLQKPLEIPDSDVFDEVKWPPMANVLIVKLIIWELILLSVQGSMTSTMQGSEGVNSTQTTDVLLTDYRITLGLSEYNPLTIHAVYLGGEAIPTNAVIGTFTELVTFLNSFEKGVWEADEDNGIVFSNGNMYSWQKFIYIQPPQDIEQDAIFQQINQRLSQITSPSNATSGNIAAGARGPLKSIETGPSKVEWHSSASFWSNMFRTSSKEGQLGGGVIDDLKQEICMYAGSIGIRLPFCPKKIKTTLFTVGQKKRRC